MELLVAVFEMIGTVSFAFSGAMTGLKKNMDIFGVCILGLTTAVGGGVIRDIILGNTPPNAFRDPKFAIVAMAVSVIAFLPSVRHLFLRNHKLYDIVLLLTDSAGLAIFTVCGLRVAINAGFCDNVFLTVFVAVLTGVGGGVMRDIFAGDRPYIFIKHIYALASVAGAVLCRILWTAVSPDVGMLAGFALIIVIRLCSAKFRWSLPHPTDVEEME